MKNTHSNPSHADLDRLLHPLDPEEADALRHVWNLAAPEEPGALPTPEAADSSLNATVDAALDRFHQARTVASTSRRDRAAVRRAPRLLRRGVWLGTAAVVALLIALLSWPTTLTLQAPLGEQHVATLPDGSTVELNSGTTLYYSNRLLSARQVRLSGEAFFAVTPARQPFVVQTFNAEVRVLGTQFNVRARVDHGTTVALEEGQVTLAARPNPEAPVTLTPGETYHIMPATAARDAVPQPQAQPLEDALAWRRGDLVFKAMPVGAMLDEIARRFAVTIEAPASIRQRTLTLALRQPANAEGALRDLTTALGVQYHPTQNGFAVREPLP